MTKKTIVTAALGNRYDTQYLIRKELGMSAYDLDFADAGEHPWSSFHDMVTTLPWDIGEQAFSHYLIAIDQGVPLTAIPVFPSRFFPQLGAVVSRTSGIKTAKDLEGKRVGVMGFGYNPAVWLRYILQHFYKVDLESIIWVEDENDYFLNGLDYPRPSRFQIETAKGFDSLKVSGSNPGSITALEEGVIDAFFAPAAGPPHTTKTRPLFADAYAEIDNWMSSHSVFPINTVITLKRETVEKYPHLATELFTCLQEARRKYHNDPSQAQIDHLGISADYLREKNLFPDEYGFQENLNVISTMIDACYEQGVIKKRYFPDELFLNVNP